jgi:hypothetical protein
MQIVNKMARKADTNLGEVFIGRLLGQGEFL